MDRNKFFAKVMLELGEHLNCHIIPQSFGRYRSSGNLTQQRELIFTTSVLSDIANFIITVDDSKLKYDGNDKFINTIEDLILTHIDGVITDLQTRMRLSDKVVKCRLNCALFHVNSFRDQVQIIINHRTKNNK